jgi:hypothetical protein
MGTSNYSDGFKRDAVHPLPGRALRRKGNQKARPARRSEINDISSVCLNARPVSGGIP